MGSSTPDIGTPGVKPAACRASSPVVLVVPPFRQLLLPALGAGILKANLMRNGIEVEVLYLNLSFADRIGVRIYQWLAREYLLLTGEFLFACVRFCKTRDDIDRYVREILLPSPEARSLVRLLPPRKIVDALEDLAGEAAEFTRQAVGEILARNPLLVGFSSSASENLASLSIAHLLKQRDPSVATIIGGANALGEMGRELFAQFPELDYVCQGEGDVSLVDLARERLEHRAPVPIPGILRRDLDGESPPPVLLTAAQLEDAPPPDFNDYFDQRKTLRENDLLVPGLAIEASRGCWWGEKRSCAFCGLSGESFVFRAKSPNRVHQEIQALVERYGVHSIHVVDLMLDPRTLPELLTPLAERPVAHLFWETGGRLSQEQVRLLARACVRRIQPGFEALSDESLRLMNKPTTALANVRTLKWCTEAGVRTFWNYLTGMPGEPQAELDEIEERIRAIHHLYPPTMTRVVRIQRFSRYFMGARELGLGDCWPEPFYRHLYPFGAEVLGRLAYFFETDHTTWAANSEAYRRLSRAVQQWQRLFRHSHLEIIPGRRADWVLDSRRCARRRLRRLTNTERSVLAACNAGATASQVLKSLSPEADSQAVTAALQSLVRDRFVLRLGERFLSLPLRPSPAKETPAWPPGGMIKRLRVGEAIRAVRRLRVSPVDAIRFALALLPSVALEVHARTLAAGWNSFARVAKLVLGKPSPR